jgi:hypothetical protein
VCIGVAGAASADILWDQSAIEFGVTATVDQEFGDFPTYSSYMVNDVVAGAGGWVISDVTTYYTNAGGTWGGVTQGRLSIFDKVGSAPAAGDDPSAELIVPVSVVNGPNGWEVTASGLAEVVSEGEHWIGLTPIADFGVFGQEFHLGSPIIGGDSAWRNPGGSFGFGTGWTTIGTVSAGWDGFADPAILIQGVPEPATLALLGLGALALIRRR